MENPRTPPAELSSLYDFEKVKAQIYAELEALGHETKSDVQDVFAAHPEVLLYLLDPEKKKLMSLSLCSDSCVRDEGL